MAFFRAFKDPKEECNFENFRNIGSNSKATSRMALRVILLVTLRMTLGVTLRVALRVTLSNFESNYKSTIRVTVRVNLFKLQKHFQIEHFKESSAARAFSFE